MNKPVIIIGNGGHAGVLTEILQMQRVQILGFTAPEKEANSFGLTYLGEDQRILAYSLEEVELVLGIGTVNRSKSRKNLFHVFQQHGYSFKNVIHPTAILAPSVQIGECVQIMAGVILQTGVKIADNVIVNTGSIIDHDTQIAEHVHIAPGCTLSGGVQIGAYTHIGTGTTVIQSIKIGAECLIGAGAVVVKSIADGAVAYGVPAKEV